MTIAVDLGKIRFVWRGNYDAATTYTKDDVVYQDGSAYVCKHIVCKSEPSYSLASVG